MNNISGSAEPRTRKSNGDELTSQKTPSYGFLARNVSWLILGGFISRSISILTLPIITAYLAPEAFGVIALFSVEASLLGGLYGLGLHAFAGRMIYKYDRRNKRTSNQYLGVILFYLLIFSLIGLAISLPFAKSLKNLILRDVIFPNSFLYYVPIIQAFLLNIYGFTSNGFLNLQENRKLFICGLANLVLLIPAEIIGLVWFGFTWVEIVMLQLIAQGGVTVLSIWLIRKRLGFSFKRLKILKPALRYSLPYVPLNFSSWISQQIDKVFLGRMHAVSYVGVYAIGLKFSEVFKALARPLTTSIKPEISKRLDMHEHRINEGIRDFFSFFFQSSVFLIFVVSIFSREIVSILADVKYFSAFKIVPIVMLGYLFGELSGIFHLKFIYRNKTVFFPVVVFLGTFLNVSLNYYLIPKFDILGAALATTFANLIVLFVCYYISQRLHFTYYGLLKNFSILLLAISLIFIIQIFLPKTTTFIFLKIFLVILYAFLLYRYLLHTNKTFEKLKDKLITRIARKWSAVANRKKWN